MVVPISNAKYICFFFQICFILLRPSTIRTRGRLRHSRSFSSPQRILHTPEKDDDDDGSDDHKMIKNMIKMIDQKMQKKVECVFHLTNEASNMPALVKSLHGLVCYWPVIVIVTVIVCNWPGAW